MAEGVSYGVTWSGGVGEILARWLTQGEPGCDVSIFDCRRFDAQADFDSIDARATAAYLGSYSVESTD